MIAKTWKKDSYGLFDYQAKEDQYDMLTEYIEENVFIVRDNKSSFLLMLQLAEPCS